MPGINLKMIAEILGPMDANVAANAANSSATASETRSAASLIVAGRLDFYQLANRGDDPIVFVQSKRELWGLG